jgi:flagellar hook-associated protein 3 FlgL
VIESGEILNLHRATDLRVAPTAIYQGDSKNKPGVEIHNGYGFSVNPINGSFDGDVEVDVSNYNSGNNVLQYRYRVSNGDWKEEVAVDVGSGGLPVTLNLPGGAVQVEDAGASGGMSSITDLRFSLQGTKVVQMNSQVHAYAEGDFDRNVLVELTSGADLTGSGALSYEYSFDGGQTWENGTTTIQGSGTYTSLPVSSGILNIAPTEATQNVSGGDQLLIQPRTAGISSEISKDVHLDMNNVGSEVFGGHYQNDDGLEPAFEEEETRNMFLGVGRLISALENNDSDAINESLAYVDGAMEQIARKQAEIGARENRLDVSEKVLSNLELNQKERKSYIEDVDFAELMSELTQQQTVYQAVLKSSSMIMRMSLVNYL